MEKYRVKKFVIAIEEMICQEFDVVAETAEEAMETAEKLYKAGTFVLVNVAVCAKQMAIVSPDEDVTEWCEF